MIKLTFKKWIISGCIIVICIVAYALFQRIPRTQIVGIIVTDTPITHQRIYASFTIETIEDTEYEWQFLNFNFEGIEPLAYFINAVRPVTFEDVQDFNLFRTHNFSFTTGNNWRLNTMQRRNHTAIDARVTMYVTPGKSASLSHYLIYQQPDGTIYLAPDFSRTASVSGGFNSFTSLGLSGRIFSDNFSSIEVIVQERFIPVKVGFIQMDVSHSVVSQLEFDPTNLPDELSLEPDTIYIIVEIHELKLNGEVNIVRKLPEFYGVHIYRVRSDGVIENSRQQKTLGVFEQHWIWFEQ